jgi:hypothetical protein
MVGAFPGRREERIHDLACTVVVVGHEVRVGGKDNFLRVAKVGGDLGQAESFRQPCRGGSVPQYVTAVLPSPLRINASSPPGPTGARRTFSPLRTATPKPYSRDHPAQVSAIL